jgi:hypothetical protein
MPEFCTSKRETPGNYLPGVSLFSLSVIDVEDYHYFWKYINYKVLMNEKSEG